MICSRIWLQIFDMGRSDHHWHILNYSLNKLFSSGCFEARAQCYGNIFDVITQLLTQPLSKSKKNEAIDVNCAETVLYNIDTKTSIEYGTF
jgi:hypothetical protein